MTDPKFFEEWWQLPVCACFLSTILVFQEIKINQTVMPEQFANRTSSANYFLQTHRICNWKNMQPVSLQQLQVDIMQPIFLSILREKFQRYTSEKPLLQLQRQGHLSTGM